MGIYHALMPGALALISRIIIFIIMVFTIPSKAFGEKDMDSLTLSDCYGTIIKEWSDSNVVYVNKKGREYILSLNGVYFKDRELALKEFIYRNLKQEYECNFREIFVVLFNQKLKIEEVRIANLHANKETVRCDHQKDYINAIRKTRGKWIRKEKKQKMYVYIFSMHIH